MLKHRKMRIAATTCLMVVSSAAWAQQLPAPGADQQRDIINALREQRDQALDAAAVTNARMASAMREMQKQIADLQAKEAKPPSPALSSPKK
jgi:uncharacterized protein YeeX (DUF496 family)